MQQRTLETCNLHASGGSKEAVVTEPGQTEITYQE